MKTYLEAYLNKEIQAGRTPHSPVLEIFFVHCELDLK